MITQAILFDHQRVIPCKITSVNSESSANQRNSHVLLMLSNGSCAGPMSVLVDLVAAFEARFLKLGGPVRAAHTLQVRRKFLHVGK